MAKNWTCESWSPPWIHTIAPHMLFSQWLSEHGISQRYQWRAWDFTAVSMASMGFHSGINGEHGISQLYQWRAWDFTAVSMASMGFHSCINGEHGISQRYQWRAWDFTAVSMATNKKSHACKQHKSHALIFFHTCYTKPLRAFYIINDIYSPLLAIHHRLKSQTTRKIIAILKRKYWQM